MPVVNHFQPHKLDVFKDKSTGQLFMFVSPAKSQLGNLAVMKDIATGIVYAFEKSEFGRFTKVGDHAHSFGDLVKEVADKFEVAATFGQNTTFNAVGSKAVAALLTDLADRLDQIAASYTSHKEDGNG